MSEAEVVTESATKAVNGKKNHLGAVPVNGKTQPPAVADVEDRIRYHLRYSIGLRPEMATARDVCTAASLAIRETIVDQMLKTRDRYERKDAKHLYYLSMEFLVGRSLINNLINLNLYDAYNEAIDKLGFTLDDIEEHEPDAALGNGGLGRLAACFLDSLATLDMPGYGYGINYEFGLFRQRIENGYQRELPDNWLREKTPWQFERPEDACLVPVYGSIMHETDRDGEYNPMWLDWKLLVGVPHDMPIVGYGSKTVNYLRLYTARASDEFDMRIFNQGDYIKAVEQKISSETISKLLYPSDAVASGKELRLLQEYFLVACSLRDIFRRFEKAGKPIQNFNNAVAIQLNDTHPALAVAEMMRILLDEHDLSWDPAWEITVRTLGYTNHTLLPEALEKWSVELIEKVLPRHLQLIYEINHRFLKEVQERWPNDAAKMRRMSLVEESDEKCVRMANLAIVGSHSVNGVAALHSDLVKRDLVPDFFDMWPERFNNKTNGITQRRWLLKSNPELSGLITSSLGDGWVTDLTRLSDLAKFADDSAFQKQFTAIKERNKIRLATIIKEATNITVDPKSLFDVQVKRIHEYKRQLLNVLQIIHQYLAIVEDGRDLPWPKTYIFAGKAAPGYTMAKLIIKLVNSVAMVVNSDERVKDQLKVVFIPDYRVSLAEKIFPAAELSEQISTAGKEASGTGNMKFMLNGALTIGTLDGANVEIREEVGDENIFIFGLTAPEVKEMMAKHNYKPWVLYNKSMTIKRVMDAIANNLFSARDPEIFQPIFEKVVYSVDEYVHLADLESYIDMQQQAGVDYKNARLWTRKGIINVARSGKFTSDRTIRQYADEIWDLKSVR